MKEDTESLEIFQNEVARQLISEKGRQMKVFIFIFSLCFFLPNPSPITASEFTCKHGMGGVVEREYEAVAF